MTETRRRARWVLAATVGLAGCYDGLEPEDEEYEDRQSCAARPPTDGSIVVHYGAKNEIAPKNEFFAAIGGQGEQVIVTRALKASCDGSFGLWRDRSWHNRWAFKMTADDLAKTLMCGQFVDLVETRVDEGWDYVAVDEIRTKNAAILDTNPPQDCAAYQAHLASGKRHHDWRNGARLSNLLVSGLEQLAQDGYDRRFLPYLSSSVVSNPARAQSLRNVLRAVRDHARVGMLELYRHTSDGHTVADHRQYFDTRAAWLESSAPGINDRTITVLGVSNAGGAPFLDQPTKDLDELVEQFSALHQGQVTRRQPGVGAYAWASTKDTAAYGDLQLARKFRDLANWYAERFGVEPAPAGPDDPAQPEPACNEPHEADVDGVCIPSCGMAGGNACVPASSHLCDGHPQFESYDCEICCAVPSHIDIHRGWSAELRTHKYARAVAHVQGGSYVHEGPVFRVATGGGDQLAELVQCTKKNGKPFYTTDAGCEGAGQKSGTLGFIGTTPLPGTQPLHRLYKSENGAHFYGAGDAERMAAEGLGYHYEGVQGWVW